jgi:hypothetical protein
MAKNKFSVQAEQKILYSKEQSRNVRENRFLAFRFSPHLFNSEAPAHAGRVVARGGVR